MRPLDWLLMAVAASALVIEVLYGGPICPPGRPCEWPVVGVVAPAIVALAVGAVLVPLVRRRKAD